MTRKTSPAAKADDKKPAAEPEKAAAAGPDKPAAAAGEPAPAAAREPEPEPKTEAETGGPAKVAAADLVTGRVISPLRRDGVSYGIGKPIRLPAAEFEALRKALVVEAD